MNSPSPEARNGGWQSFLTDGLVTQCRLDHAFTLIVSTPGEPPGTVTLTLEAPFVVTANGRAVAVDPEGAPQGLLPALAFLHLAITEVAAHEDGRLRVAARGGTSIEVPASRDYEAWNLVTADGLRVVAMPGGELAIWSPPAESVGELD